MKKLLLFFLFLVTLGSCVSCVSTLNEKLNTETASKNQKISEHVIKSTVTLVSPEQGPYCSGFFISPTKIITARHCIDQDNILTNTEVKEFDQIIFEAVFKSEKYYIMKYSKKNSQLENIDVNVVKLVYIVKTKSPENQLDMEDVAILEISQKYKSDHWLEFDSFEPYHGKKLMIISSPFGIPWTLTYGNVAHMEYDSSGNYLGFLANSSIMAGSSGGAVVNTRGECIGVLSSVLDVNKKDEENHIPEGNIGLVIGAKILQQHLKDL